MTSDMTHPDGRPYTRAEKLAILAEARATARLLLEKLELLTQIDVGDDDVAKGAVGD